MNRFTRFTLFSVTMFMISVCTVLGQSTWYIPDINFTTIQNCVNNMWVTDGDYVVITRSYTDPGFNCTKRLYFSSEGQNVCMDGLAQISNTCSFSNIYFTNSNNTRDIFQINPGSFYVEFWDCVLNQGSNPWKSCIYDRGSAGLYLYRTTLLCAGWGIFADNTSYVSQWQCQNIWLDRPIQYQNNSSGEGSAGMWISECSFSENTINNGWCTRTAFPNLQPIDFNVVGFQDSYFSANGTGSVPIKLEGHNAAYINYNTFYNCPTGYRVSQTSNDVIMQNIGNTGCQ